MGENQIPTHLRYGENQKAFQNHGFQWISMDFLYVALPKHKRNPYHNYGFWRTFLISPSLIDCQINFRKASVGGEIVIKNLVSDFKEVYKKDIKGKSIDDIPMMNNIENIESLNISNSAAIVFHHLNYIKKMLISWKIINTNQLLYPVELQGLKEFVLIIF